MRKSYFIDYIYGVSSLYVFLSGFSDYYWIINIYYICHTDIFMKSYHSDGTDIISYNFISSDNVSGGD